MYEVSKFDLCVLTRNGRSIDGNWTVCWRNLDFYWRNLTGLFTETGRSIDENWTIYWRKLDANLSETGRSVDGNWMVYLRKQCIRFSSFWWPENGIFAEFWNPRFRGHSILYLIFCSLERRKCVFCRVMKNRAHEYQNSCEQIFALLAAWKRGSQDSGKIEFTGLILK